MPDHKPFSSFGRESSGEANPASQGTVPLTIEQIDTMLRLLTAGRGEIRSFLDLGCNDGVLASAILTEHPQASGVTIDSADQPLESVRQQLNPRINQLDFVLADIRRPDWVRGITPPRTFDAVITGFATHDLSVARKRELFEEIQRLLNPGGIFLLMEHVASATRWTEELLDDYRINAVFGEQLRKSAGKPRAEVAREFFASGAGEALKTAPLEVQCDWLREVGFQSVDCYLKVSEMAVFGGQKPGLPNPTP